MKYEPSLLHVPGSLDDPLQEAADDCTWITKNGAHICITGGHGAHGEPGQPKIYRTSGSVTQASSWGDVYWKYPDGSIAPGYPLTKEELPPTLYHTTTALDAIRQSGMLLGLQDAGGMGGGQFSGVSLTTSIEDARLMKRELTRAVGLAKGDSADLQATLTKFARQDERVAGVPKGSLDHAVDHAMSFFDGNKNSLDWLPAQNTAAAIEGNRKRLAVEAFSSAYLLSRDMAGGPKNPVLFANYDKLKTVNPKDIGIVMVKSTSIPDSALIIQGTDKFLHEIRVGSDIPLTSGFHTMEAKDEV